MSVAASQPALQPPCRRRLQGTCAAQQINCCARDSFFRRRPHQPVRPASLRRRLQNETARCMRVLQRRRIARCSSDFTPAVRAGNQRGGSRSEREQREARAADANSARGARRARKASCVRRHREQDARLRLARCSQRQRLLGRAAATRPLRTFCCRAAAQICSRCGACCRQRIASQKRQTQEQQRTAPSCAVCGAADSAARQRPEHASAMRTHSGARLQQTQR